jgi:hypothetical protein
MTTKPSEKDVVAAWQRRVYSRTPLTTEQGEVVEVVYPGRRNDGRGADYQDAVISRGGRLMKGDIEVHVRSKDWISHGHHLDPAYNRVILHVVWWHDGGVSTNLCNGGTVPVLALSTSHAVEIERGAEMPVIPALSRPYAGGISCVTVEMLAGFLDRAGDERFLAKADEFRAQLAEMDTGQVLYRGIMGALGYSQNKVPCLELADRLPLAILESIASAATSDEECVTRLQALLIGTAGLLPSQRADSDGSDRWNSSCIKRLEGFWSTYGNGRAMPPGMWHLSCTRPYNSPLRRLVAMSYLITRYRKEGLLSGLWGRYVADVPSGRDWCRVEEGLVVSADDCWWRYLDFNTASDTALGEGRAADIMVNVILPFTYAWGRFSGRRELTIAAIGAYRNYPRLADNALLKHMRSQLRIGHHMVNTARRQQGLLHIYRTLCTQGRCERCPLIASGRDRYPEPATPAVSKLW